MGPKKLENPLQSLTQVAVQLSQQRNEGQRRELLRRHRSADSPRQPCFPRLEALLSKGPLCSSGNLLVPSVVRWGWEKFLS